MEVEHWLG